MGFRTGEVIRFWIEIFLQFIFSPFSKFSNSKNLVAGSISQSVGWLVSGLSVPLKVVNMSLSSSWDLCIHKQAAFSEGYSCFSLKVVYLKFPKKKNPPKKFVQKISQRGMAAMLLLLFLCSSSIIVIIIIFCTSNYHMLYCGVNFPSETSKNVLRNWWFLYCQIIIIYKKICSWKKSEFVTWNSWGWNDIFVFLAVMGGAAMVWKTDVVHAGMGFNKSDFPTGFDIAVLFVVFWWVVAFVNYYILFIINDLSEI